MVRGWIKFAAMVGVSAASLTVGSIAIAQPSPPANVPPASGAAPPQQLFEQGLAAAEANRWDEARDLFARAFQGQRHWRIAINLGRAERRLGKWRDAAEHLTFGLREAPADKLAGKDRMDAVAMLEDVKKKVAALRIKVNVDNAEVLIDDVLVGTTPLVDPVYVEAGARVVTIRRSGYATARQSVVGMDGKELPLAIVLASEGPNRKRQDEKKTYTSIWFGEADKAIFFTGVTVTGVALLSGVGLAAGAQVKGSEFGSALAEVPIAFKNTCNESNHPNCPKNVQKLANAKVDLANASFYMFVTSAAFGAGTLAYWLVTRSRSSAKVYASISPTSAALAGQW